MRQLTDMALVAQVLLLHSQRAFGQLVERYQSPVRRFFLHQTCGDAALSDDLAQETFIKAWLNIADFKNLSRFSTWLYRIAYNVFYDYIRSRKQSVELDESLADALYHTPHDQVGRSLDICRALRRLGEKERVCITLFYLEEQSIENIAAITGYPQGTVKGLLARGRAKMAHYLKANGYDEK